MNETRKSLVADLSLLLLLCHETLTCDQNVRVIKNRGTANGLAPGSNQMITIF